MKHPFKKVDWKFDPCEMTHGGNATAKYLRKTYLNNGYITDQMKTTTAKLNKDTKLVNKRYWANPSIDFLKHDWILSLNDISSRILYIFWIPANSISPNAVNTRMKGGRKEIDIEIVNINGAFICRSSGIVYNQWLVETVNY